MNNREKNLAVGVAAVALLWGGNLGWEKYQDTLKKNRNQQLHVAQQLSTARVATARGKRAQKQLEQWQQQSLPTDPDIAKSLYQDWLQHELNTSGLKTKGLTPSLQTRSNSSQQFSFVVAAEGKLEQLTDFLYQFYRAPHLHRILKANLRPSNDRKSLTIGFTVEALALARADRKDQLATGNNDEVKQPLEDFRKNIVGRNLFATYQPPRSRPSPRPAGEREARDTRASQAKFVGIHYGQDGWQMTVRMEDSGKKTYYHEGDTIKIGRFEGTIEQLDGDQRQAIVSTDSDRMLVRFGQNLAEAQSLDRPSRASGAGRMRRGRYRGSF